MLCSALIIIAESESWDSITSIQRALFIIKSFLSLKFSYFSLSCLMVTSTDPLDSFYCHLLYKQGIHEHIQTLCVVVPHVPM